MNTKPTDGYKIISHGGIGNREKNCNLTGSCHELSVTIGGEIFRILIDMGAYQGPGRLERNFENIFDENNKKVDAVLFTHGHMDHIGDALNLTKFAVEKVISGSETKKIMQIALTDAVKIEETDYEIKKANFRAYLQRIKDAVKIVKEYEKWGIKRSNNGNRMATTTEEQGRKEYYLEAKKLLEKEGVDYKNPKWQQKFQSPKKPEYDKEDVDKLVEQVETIDIKDGWTEIIPGKIAVCMFNAGHILGSMSPLFRITDANGKLHYIHFSGDIGSYKGTIAPAGLPTAPKDFPIETVLIESTYGGRVREDFDVYLSQYEADIGKDIKKYNTLVQACFSLDRLQKMLYYTILMKKKGVIPNYIPIFVDSKMGVQYIDPYIRSAMAQIKENTEKNFENQITTKTDWLEDFIQFLNPENGYYEVLDHENRDMILANTEGKKIILTASGMAEGGPIIEYIKRYGGADNAVFYFPGHLVEWTRGHTLAIENWKQHAVDGEKIEIRAKMKYQPWFSGHGDEKDIIRYLSEMRLKSDAHILAVHGDTQTSSLALKHTLERKNFPQKVIVPEIGEIYRKDFNEK